MDGRYRSPAMARTARAKEQRPPALPPERQTVGQLVAETLRLYGSRFLVALPLGLPVAVADQVALGQAVEGRVVVLVVASPFFTVAYAAACTLVLQVRLGATTWGAALFAGTIAFLPAAIFFPWFALVSILWLALVGHVVPVMAKEGVGVRRAFARAVALGRADYVHSAGGLATLVLVFGLTRIALGGVLRSQADNTIRVSVFLADTVLAPILFLGGALLYLNLAARVGSRPRRRRDRDAALPDAHDAHGEGRPDPELEPRAPA
jgi:hypothetical protein